MSTVCFCNVPCIEQTFPKKYNVPIIQVKGGTVMSFFSRRDGFAGHRKQKPSYSLGRNIGYMAVFAWRERPSVILLVLAMYGLACETEHYKAIAMIKI